MMRTKKILASLLLLLSVGVFFTPPVQAASDARACHCYCAFEGKASEATGATFKGDYSLAVCQKTCDAFETEVAVCAYSADQLPTQNLLCFNEGQCAAQQGVLDKEFQPGECQDGMNYCYPKKTISTVLSVSIGDLKKTSDLGEYISSIYSWMLGVSVTIATVLIMIGGLQYAFAGGAGDTSKAKKRIKDAVIGFVLLLSAYAILATVNPALVKLQIPSFPMIRTVVLIDEGTSCGWLIGDYGSKPYLRTSGAPADSPYAKGQPLEKTPYVLKGGTATNGTSCGSIAEVDTDPDGSAALDGTTCSFDYCTDKEERCLGRGEDALCTKCGDITGTSSISSGIFPSSETCAALSLGTTLKNPKDPSKGLKEANYCFFTRDTAGATTTLAVTAAVGTCAELKINCNSISDCSDYMTQTVSVDLGFSFLGFFGASGLGGDQDAGTICSADPCGVGAKTNTTCTPDPGTLYDSCDSVEN